MNHQALLKANQLLKLALNNHTDQIYHLLNNLDGSPKYKGDVFEYFLARLYKEMGWITQVTGGKNDKGVDILLYHPSEPNQVHAIVQAKNMKKPLLKKDMLNEYMNFFGTEFSVSQGGSAKKYHCYKLIVISLNGYTAGALNCKNPQETTAYKVYCYHWDYVKKLIQEYAKTHNISSVFISRSQSFFSHLSVWFRHKMRTVLFNFQKYLKTHPIDDIFRNRSQSVSEQLSIRFSRNRFPKKAVLFKSLPIIFIIWLFWAILIPAFRDSDNNTFTTQTLTHEMRVRLNIASLSSLAKKECNRLNYPIAQCREKLVSQYQEEYGSLKTGLIVYFCGPRNFQKANCKRYGEKRAGYVLAEK